jgi:hypothetical protein
MVERRINDFQINPFVTQREFQVTNKAVLNGNTTREQDVSFRLYPAVDRCGERSVPNKRAHN